MDANNLNAGKNVRNSGLTRRGFLGGAAALGPVALTAAKAAAGTQPDADGPLPHGKALRLQPALMYHLDQPREKTSWRSYGGLQTPKDVEEEIRRIRPILLFRIVQVTLS